MIKTVAEIGKIIKQARKRIGFNQQKAAEYAGVGTRFLSDLENGKSTVQLDLTLKVLKSNGFNVYIVPRSNVKLIQHIEDNLNE
jgi:y4mF family transcriptional regulator